MTTKLSLLVLLPVVVLGQLAHGPAVFEDGSDGMRNQLCGGACTPLTVWDHACANSTYTETGVDNGEMRYTVSTGGGCPSEYTEIQVWWKPISDSYLRHEHPEGFWSYSHYLQENPDGLDENAVSNGNYEALRYRIKANQDAALDGRRNFHIGMYTGHRSGDEHENGMHYYNHSSIEVEADEWIVALVGPAPNAANAGTGWSTRHHVPNPSYWEPAGARRDVGGDWAPWHYWWGGGRFYLNYTVPGGATFPLTARWDDMAFVTPSGDNPWGHVQSLQLTYDGDDGRYNIGWNGPRGNTGSEGTGQAYGADTGGITWEIYRHTASMKVNGLSAGTLLTTVSGTDGDSTPGYGTSYTSSRLDEFWAAVRPRVRIIGIGGGAGSGEDIWIETDYPHLLETGDTVTISNVGTGVDGTHTVTQVDDGNGWTERQPSVDAGTDTLTLTDHYLAEDQWVRLRGDGTVPAPLNAGTSYYAVNVTANTFQLASSQGGAAIDLTDGGSGEFFIQCRMREIHMLRLNGTADVSLPAYSDGRFAAGYFVSDTNFVEVGITNLGRFPGTISAPDAPSITTTSLPDGTVGQAYSAPVVATGGATPYSWSVVGGSLCEGLTLSAQGTLSGTPTAAGTCTFTARVADNNSLTDTHSLDLTVGAPAKATSLRLLANPGASSAVLVYSKPADAVCSAQVFPSGTVSERGTGTVRLVALSSLNSDMTNTLEVDCGGQVESMTFGTAPYSPPESRNVTVSVRVNGQLADGVDTLRIDYGDSPENLTTSVSTACSEGVCTVNLQADTGRILWMRRRWEQAGVARAVSTVQPILIER